MTDDCLSYGAKRRKKARKHIKGRVDDLMQFQTQNNWSAFTAWTQIMANMATANHQQEEG